VVSAVEGEDETMQEQDRMTEEQNNKSVDESSNERERHVPR
jgi:hypothetical protein